MNIVVVGRQIGVVGARIQFHRGYELLSFSDRAIVRRSIGVAADRFGTGRMENENHAFVIRLQRHNKCVKREIGTATPVFPFDDNNIKNYKK